MKVLVTGHTGFLGRHITRTLLDDGHEIHGLLHRRAVRKKDCDPRIKLIFGDVSDPDVVERAVEGVDAVIHAAWVWPKGLTAQLSRTANLRAAELLWDASVRAGVTRFAFISSVAVYGMRRKSKNPVSESSSVAEGSELDHEYPKQKLQVEEFLLARKSESTRPHLAIFRPGIIVDDAGKGGRTLGPFTLMFGMGMNHLPFIHAKDVASALEMWLTKGDGDGLYNIVPTRQTSRVRWRKAWARFNGRTLRFLRIPPAVLRLAAIGGTAMNRLRGKSGSLTSKVDYALACECRNLRYSADALRQDLAWSDPETMKYLSETS